MRGGCLCGAVRFEIGLPVRAVVACHCGQCRKWSGHYVAATSAYLENFKLLAEGGLRWHQSSPVAKRGFCGVCGSSLFWRPESGGRISILAGALDGKIGLRTAAHIYTESKGDYYAIPADGAAQYPDCGANLEVPK